MSESRLDASITVKQDGIDSFAKALWNPQHYEIYIDDQKVGVLDGYHNRQTISISPGPHWIFVRAYARDSVSPTRVYGYSTTRRVDLGPGKEQTLHCGVVRGPRVRTILILSSALLTILLFVGLGLAPGLQPRVRYSPVLIMALIGIACSWYGHSTRPGSSIYLRESQPPE